MGAITFLQPILQRVLKNAHLELWLPSPKFSSKVHFLWLLDLLNAGPTILNIITDIRLLGKVSGQSWDQGPIKILFSHSNFSAILNTGFV